MSIVQAQEAYERLREHRKGSLDHYFRNLYHIVKFVDQNAPSDTASAYTAILRAQLSTPELLLLFYDGLSTHGEKFNPLIRKYDLLQQLAPEEVPAYNHWTLYPRRVSGS